MKLQPGDYVLTKDIRDKEQARDIAVAFGFAGARKGAGYPYPDYYKWTVMVWDFGSGKTNQLMYEPMIGRRLTPEQILDKEWDGEGLPPVNTECEYFYEEGEEWREGICVAHFKGQAVVVDTLDEAADMVLFTRVRTKKTESEKLIDDIAAQIRVGMYHCVSSKTISKEIYEKYIEPLTEDKQ